MAIFCKGGADTKEELDKISSRLSSCEAKLESATDSLSTLIDRSSALRVAVVESCDSAKKNTERFSVCEDKLESATMSLLSLIDRAELLRASWNADFSQYRQARRDETNAIKEAAARASTIRDGIAKLAESFSSVQNSTSILQRSADQTHNLTVGIYDSLAVRKKRVAKKRAKKLAKK